MFLEIAYTVGKFSPGQNLVWAYVSAVLGHLLVMLFCFVFFLSKFSIRLEPAELPFKQLKMEMGVRARQTLQGRMCTQQENRAYTRENKQTNISKS